MAESRQTKVEAVSEVKPHNEMRMMRKGISSHSPKSMRGPTVMERMMVLDEKNFMPAERFPFPPRSSGFVELQVGARLWHVTDGGDSL